MLSKENDNYKLNVILEIEDYYDWEKGNFYEKLENSAINSLYDMNKAGLARNYTNYGKLNYEVQWLKGQRMEDGSVVIIKENK